MTAPTNTRARNYICGFCSTGDCDRCPGAVAGATKTGVVACQCRKHITEVRCLACGNTHEDEVTTGWRCADPATCQGRIITKALANPLHHEIAAARRAGGEARRQELMRRTSALVMEEVRRAGIDVPAPEGRCQCEGTNSKCSAEPVPTTKRFAPGHDMSLKSALRRRARQNLDPPLAEAAVRRLAELGWSE
jgi:hypothetical protein